MRNAALVLPVVLAMACGPSKKPAGPGREVAATDAGAIEPAPAPLTSAQEAQIDRLATLFLALGRAVMAAGNDCQKMADNVNRWIDANVDERAKLMAALATMPSKSSGMRYNRRLSDELATVQGMRAGLTGCQADAALMAAWNRFDGSKN